MEGTTGRLKKLLLAARFIWTGVAASSLSLFSPALGSVLTIWVRVSHKIIGFCNYHSIFFNIASM